MVQVKLLRHRRLSITCAMLYKDCLAPVETTICDGL